MIIRNLALAILLLLSVIAHLGFAFAERFGRHPTDNARQGAAFLGTVGLFGSPAFLDGVILSAAGFICVLIGFTYAGPIALLLGLYCYEHAYVRAGQLPPLS